MAGNLTWAEHQGPGAFDAYDEMEKVIANNKHSAGFILARLNSARRFGSAYVDSDEIVGGAPFYCYDHGAHAVIYTVDDIPGGADVTVIGLCPVGRIPGFLSVDAPARFSTLP
jgi:hypothetical protein